MLSQVKNRPKDQAQRFIW